MPFWKQAPAEAAEGGRVSGLEDDPAESGEPGRNVPEGGRYEDISQGALDILEEKGVKGALEKAAKEQLEEAGLWDDLKRGELKSSGETLTVGEVESRLAGEYAGKEFFQDERGIRRLAKQDPELAVSIQQTLSRMAGEVQNLKQAGELFNASTLYTQTIEEVLNEKNLDEESVKDIDILKPKDYYNFAEIDDKGGKYQHVDSPFSSTGELKENVIYESGEYDYQYRTDENGNIREVLVTKLQLKKHEGRAPHNSKTPGKQEGDEAGHLIADWFGGSGELDNMVSQAATVNRGEYGRLEYQWAKAVKEGKEVSIHIDIDYLDGEVRPSGFRIDYAINGVFYSTNIKNK